MVRGGSDRTCYPMRTRQFAVWAALLSLPGGWAAAAEASLGELEVQRCEEKIASVHREVASRYESALQELQLNFQKAADLEGALATRAERQRMSKDGRLLEQNLVNEPKALRAVQAQQLAKLKELTALLV